MAITKEIETRPEDAKLIPLDYEDRACDFAIEALDDIRECDEARIYIKWDRLQGFMVVSYVVYRVVRIATVKF